MSTVERAASRPTRVGAARHAVVDIVGGALGRRDLCAARLSRLPTAGDGSPPVTARDCDCDV